MSKVAFVTYRQAPRITSDDSLLYRPLAQYGIKLLGAAWDDLTVTWRDYDLVVLRSTWDYHLRLPEFLAWLDRLEAENIPVWNPPSLLRWNVDKIYLQTLAERGVEIVQTHFLPQGQPADLPALLAELGWGEVVVKPTVGASAHQTWRMAATQASQNQRKVDKLLESSGVMLQPFLAEIITEGEWSLMFFRSWSGKVEFSHAVLKHPAQGDMRVQDDYGGTERAQNPPRDLLHAAYFVLEAVTEDWLYARVDGLWLKEQFILMELELIEPFLFLGQDDHAPEKFAGAIRSYLSL